MPKKYISVAQAAKRLKVSVGTIYNYCRIGTLGYRCIQNQKKEYMASWFRKSWTAWRK